MLHFTIEFQDIKRTYLRKYLVGVSKSAHAAHYPENVIIYGVNADLARPASRAREGSDGGGGEGQLQGSIVNAREVASARRLMLLGAQSEGVHVDTARGHVLVVLVGLDQVEVLAVADGEAVVTVELEESLGDGVGSVLEGHGDVDVVGTTAGNTGHGTSKEVSRLGGEEGSVGLASGSSGASSTGDLVGVVIGIGVVEPLLTPGGRVLNVIVRLTYPHQLLRWMVKVQLELVVGVGGGLVTSELQLLDQVLVGDLGEPPALIGIQVDVVHEERAGRDGGNGDVGHGGGGDTAGNGACPVAVLGVVDLEVNFAGDP